MKKNHKRVNNHNKELIFYLLKKKLTIPSNLSFSNSDFEYNELRIRLWIMSINNRHLWRHHYLGTQGIIILFSIKEINTNFIIEIINIFKDENLKDVPILIVLDKLRDEMKVLYNMLRKELESFNNYNILYLNYSIGMEEIYYGLDWLCKTMKPII